MIQHRYISYDQAINKLSTKIIKSKKRIAEQKREIKMKEKREKKNGTRRKEKQEIDIDKKRR